MADGTKKPIGDIEVGDWVWSDEPQNGQAGPRQVTASYPHQDHLLDLVLTDGTRIRTTEDHEFWNESDGEWQEAQNLDPGDQLRGKDSPGPMVVGLDWGTQESEAAFDLGVEGLHTFFVVGDSNTALAHNCFNSGRLGRNLEDAGFAKPGDGYQAHHIVPGGSYRGNADLDEAREILLRNGVDPNEASQGVWLPSGWHQSVHTNDYFAMLRRRLSEADGDAADVRGVLGDIRQDLLDRLASNPDSGNLPW